MKIDNYTKKLKEPKVFSSIMFGMIVTVLFISNASAVPYEEWNKTYNLGNANSVRQTFDGGYIVAGERYNSGWNAILFKTDRKGNILWNKILDGGSFSSVKQTKDGGYIVAGYKGDGNGGNAWIIKTDVYGNVRWNKIFEGEKYTYNSVNSVQQTNDGGYVAAGHTSSYGAGSYDIWLIKTDVYGNMQWNRTFGGAKLDTANSVQQTKDGGYIIAGQTESYGAGHNDIWIVKTDIYGNKLWDKTFGDENWNSAFSVQQTKDEGYIIAGYLLKNSGEFDTYVIKIDAHGNKQWDRTFGGANWDEAYSVQQTNDGGYIVAGYTASYDGNRNVWIIKIDTYGNKQWDKIFGGRESWEEAKSVQQTNDGGYIIAGFKDSYIWLIKLEENLLKNPGFEAVSGTLLQYWTKVQTGTKATFTYPATGRVGGKSVAIQYPTKETGKVALWQQTGIVVVPSKQYKFSGYMKLESVTGGGTGRLNGASLRINWYTSTGTLIKTDLISKSGTIGWTKYEKIFIAPSNAAKATVGGDLFNAAGKVTFDDLSFVKIS